MLGAIGKQIYKDKRTNVGKQVYKYTRTNIDRDEDRYTNAHVQKYTVTRTGIQTHTCKHIQKQNAETGERHGERRREVLR